MTLVKTLCVYETILLNMSASKDNTLLHRLLLYRISRVCKNDKSKRWVSDFCFVCPSLHRGASALALQLCAAVG